MRIELSVLVPSTPERLDDVARLVVELTAQARGLPVEVLVFLDNKWRTTGAKRNAMFDAAQGEYVTVVDEDCVVFDVALYIHGSFVKIFRYGLACGWTGPLMCWKRQIMGRYRFPDQTIDEDSAWIAAGPWKFEPIRQARIDVVLYDYRAVPGHP